MFKVETWSNIFVIHIVTTLFIFQHTVYWCVPRTTLRRSLNALRCFPFVRRGRPRLSSPVWEPQDRIADEDYGREVSPALQQNFVFLASSFCPLMDHQWTLLSPLQVARALVLGFRFESQYATGPSKVTDEICRLLQSVKLSRQVRV